MLQVGNQNAIKAQAAAQANKMQAAAEKLKKQAEEMKAQQAKNLQPKVESNSKLNLQG